MVSHLFVANWKMQLSFNQTLAFCREHYHELCELAQHNKIILCPSFPALHALAQMFTDTPVCIGAQNVSRHTSGAYTGEVSAQSLAEAGCHAAIIGHSEIRHHLHETNITIAHKLKELLKQHIIPIICIGETKEQHESGNTLYALEEQLFELLRIINEGNHTVNSYIIAYEPVWAIGTGIIPKSKELAQIFSWLHTQCAQKTSAPFSLLYGGSVNAENAGELLAINHVDGLLIGGASLDFNQFKAIAKQ